MDTTQQTQLLDNLRSHTFHRHESFERIPFVIAMMDGTLPLESYIGQLRGLAVIFSAVDQALARSAVPSFLQVRPLIKSRFDMLCADLAHFSSRLLPDILPAVRHSLSFARKISSLSAASSCRLVGFLYVLQGTTRGNQVHLPDIVRCFNLNDDNGVSFYRGYGSQTDAKWEEFRAIMNSLPDVNVQDAISGAVEIYDALQSFHESLYPLPEMNLGFTAIALNPEAGDHSVPQNPAILQAAIRGGRRCHGEFSYYEKRYGERGRRFSDSDAAWLALLTELPEEVVNDQVLWLGRILSSRGMPFLLMERQLELLLEELATIEAVQADVLQTVVADLRRQRCDLLSQNRFDELCVAVSKIISETLLVDFPDLPYVFVAAYIDTLAGMPECMVSLASWLKDSSLMTEEEILAISEIFISIDSAHTIV